jgi:hypothetical protein
MRKMSVIFVALALVVGFSVNAMAAQGLFYTEKERLATAPTKELEVYGSVRMQTYWQSYDKESIRFPATFDDDDLVWDIDDSSTRFGVRFKAGKVGANVEIRPRDRQAVKTRAMSAPGAMDMTRHWNATYDLGWGTFLLGQGWTPTFNPICNECLLGGGGTLDAYGDTGFSARAPMIQISAPIKAINGLVKFALLKPYTDTGALASTVNDVGRDICPNFVEEFDTTIPKIEASLAGAFGPLSFTVRGGYNTVEYTNTANDSSESLDSWVVAGDLTYSFGPFYVRGTGYVAQNHSTYGTGAPPVAIGLFPTQIGAATSFTDVDNYGYYGVAGFKFNDMVSVEAGWGKRFSERDSTVAGVAKDEDFASAFVLFVPISITPAFVITPEILWTDEGDYKVAGTTIDRGNKLFAGVYWRIDF